MASRTVELLLRARDLVSGPARAAQAGVKTFLDSTVGGAGRALSSLFTLRNAFIAVAAAGAARAVLAPAIEMQTFRAQLGNLLGGVDAAAARLKALHSYAAATPFDLPGVVKASIALEGMTKGALAAGEGFKFVGNLAARADVPIEDMAVTVGRLYASLKGGKPVGEAAQRLMQLGLMTPEVADQLNALTEAGIRGEAGWRIYVESMKSVEGATDAAGRTAKGAISTLADAWHMALGQIGEQLLPLFEAEVRNLIGVFEELQASGKLREFGVQAAAAVRDALAALRALVEFIGANREALVSLGIGLVALKALGSLRLAVTGVSAALAAQTAATALATGEARINTTATIAMTQANAGLALALRGVNAALGLVTAGFVGWQIGKAISETKLMQDAADKLGTTLADLNAKAGLVKDAAGHLVTQPAPLTPGQQWRIAGARDERQGERDQAQAMVTELTDFFGPLDAAAAVYRQATDDAAVQEVLRLAEEKKLDEKRQAINVKLLAELKAEGQERARELQDAQGRQMDALKEANARREQAAETEQAALENHARELQQALAQWQQAVEDAQKQADQAKADYRDPKAKRERERAEKEDKKEDEKMRQRALAAQRALDEGRPVSKRGEAALRAVRTQELVEASKAVVRNLEVELRETQWKNAQKEREVLVLREENARREKQLQGQHDAAKEKLDASLREPRDTGLQSLTPEEYVKRLRQAQGEADALAERKLKRDQAEEARAAAQAKAAPAGPARTPAEQAQEAFAAAEQKAREQAARERAERAAVREPGLLGKSWAQMSPWEQVLANPGRAAAQARAAQAAAATTAGTGRGPGGAAGGPSAPVVALAPDAAASLQRTEQHLAAIEGKLDALPPWYGLRQR